MKHYVSIDPGKKACGVAIWKKAESRFSLIWAGYVKISPGSTVIQPRVQGWEDLARNVYETIDNQIKASYQPPCIPVFPEYELILEIPQIYSGAHEEDPNDLLDLAGVQGAIVGHTRKRVAWSPLPREWKGQLPKEISQKRVESKLGDAEKRLIEWPAKSLRHNVYDALHLGLVYLENNGLR